VSEELWIPLVDEPIGSIVTQILEENPDIARLVDGPRRLLAFKTFAYIRVGVLLGELLVEHDIDPSNGSDTWIEKLLRTPEHKTRVVACVREVAETIAGDERYADDATVGPDEAARERFRQFVERSRD
jgi:hypothetical protein